MSLYPSSKKPENAKIFYAYVILHGEKLIISDKRKETGGKLRAVRETPMLLSCPSKYTGEMKHIAEFTITMSESEKVCVIVCDFPNSWFENKNKLVELTQFDWNAMNDPKNKIIEDHLIVTGKNGKNYRVSKTTLKIYEEVLNRIQIKLC